MSSSNRFQLSEVSRWLDGYRVFRQKRRDNELAILDREFRRLSAELKPLREKAAERLARETPAFNIFRILRLERKELATHSPFLANLLNPAGTHAQGDVFLSLFFECLAQKGAQLPTSLTGGRWFVRQEQVTEWGNLDIHLWNHPLRCEIIIENKIGAADQDDQLQRYWSSMLTNRALFDFQQLVYLTPQNRMPRVTGNALPPYINLTYHHDICTILRSALRNIQSPRLQISLEQYLEIAATC